MWAIQAVGCKYQRCWLVASGNADIAQWLVVVVHATAARALVLEAYDADPAGWVISSPPGSSCINRQDTHRSTGSRVLTNAISDIAEQRIALSNKYSSDTNICV